MTFIDTNMDDDTTYQGNDNEHDENETQRKGAQFIKERHGRTADHVTVAANQLDTDVLPAPESVQEVVEVRRGKTAEDDEEKEAELPREVDPNTAKQQIKDKLTTAKAGFKYTEKPEQPANDNFRQTSCWPLMDQLKRQTFHSNAEDSIKSIVGAKYLRELIDIVEADSLGSSVHLPGKDTSTDYDVQRTDSGKVYFDHGMSVDRRKVTINNADQDIRFIGSARTAAKSAPIGDGRYSSHNDPFPVRLIAARQELDTVVSYVGPLLWTLLKAAISDNATMTDIGETVGVKSKQASIVGTAFIRLALTGATEALSRFNEVKDAPRRTTPMPDKSRGSFYNNTRNHVVKVAA